MATLKNYRPSVRKARRYPVPVGKPPRLSVEQARARGRNSRKPKSR
jgi:hypothetical protein